MKPEDLAAQSDLEIQGAICRKIQEPRRTLWVEGLGFRVQGLGFRSETSAIKCTKLQGAWFGLSDMRVQVLCVRMRWTSQTCSTRSDTC